MEVELPNRPHLDTSALADRRRLPHFPHYLALWMTPLASSLLELKGSGLLRSG